MSPSSSTAPPTSGSADDATSGRAPRWRWAVPVAVAVVALVVRLSAVQRGGGFYGYFGYDEGVYFAAAASLLDGRLPYRDFVLLHPPGIMMALAPFAELGRLTSDRDALAVARLAWLMLGALNAALAARVAGVLGPSAALVAGLFAATWFPAAYGERGPLLEPLGNLALLTALLLIAQRPRRLSERYAEVFAGVALGLGTCVKVWGVVPLAVVAGTLLVTRGWRAGGRIVAGAAAAGVVVCAPFLLAAPREMPRMLVLAQAGREPNGYPFLRRPAFLLGVEPYLRGHAGGLLVPATLVACAVLGAAAVLALRAPPARLWVALLVGHVAALFASTVYFPHYSAFLTVPIALVLGAGAAVWSQRVAPRAPRGVRVAVTAATAGTLVLLGTGTALATFGERYPGAKLARFVPAEGCVRADDAGALVLLNVLTRDLRRGCELPVDFTGLTHYRPVRGADGSIVSRSRNEQWQQRARSYLTSGAATVLVRRTGNAFDRTTRRELAALPVLGRVGRYTVLGPPR